MRTICDSCSLTERLRYKFLARDLREVEGEGLHRLECCILQSDAARPLPPRRNEAPSGGPNEASSFVGGLDRSALSSALRPYGAYAPWLKGRGVRGTTSGQDP